ncbi:MAG: hypothetical protein ACP5QT_04565 [Brevinematia bacterium]
MTFFSYFSGIIYNFISPFNNLLRINELCKTGFYKKRLFYYSLLVYLMALTSLILSEWIGKGRNIAGPGILIINLIIILLLDFFYIFISFSIFHFLKIKIDFESFSILYLVSSYTYIILLPLCIILKYFLKDRGDILFNVVFLFFSIVGLLLKIKAYSIVTNAPFEKGFLYYILPFLFITILAVFFFIKTYVAILQFFV